MEKARIAEYLKMHREFRELARGEGLNPLELNCVFYLGLNGYSQNGSNPRGALIGEVAQNVDIVTSIGAVSTALTVLWREKKLVRKIRDRENLRIKYVRLNPKGEELYHKLIQPGQTEHQ